MRTSSAIACLLILTALAAAAQPASHYRVEASVWNRGVLTGEHQLVLPPAQPERFEAGSGDTTWRVEIELESPEATEGADPDALWFRVGIEQRIDGDWVFLTDTMIGTRLGQPGHVSVVDNAEDGRAVARENAALWIELKADSSETE